MKIAHKTQRDGWLIWRDKFVEWKYVGFVSHKNLTFQPHFELTVTDKEKEQSITFPNIELKTKKLKDIKNFMELPVPEQEAILNAAVDTLEKEYASGQTNEAN